MVCIYLIWYKHILILFNFQLDLELMCKMESFPDLQKELSKYSIIQ